MESSPAGASAPAAGGKAAVDQLMVRVYGELRSLAARYLRQETKSHVLQATALVHEAYARLAKLRAIQWQGKTHFLAVAATQMRRVLLDHARAEMAAKRGNRALHVTLAEAVDRPITPAQLLDLQDALEELGKRHARQERVAELRLFSGMDFHEISVTVGSCERTVREDWTVARAWLARRLSQ